VRKQLGEVKQPTLIFHPRHDDQSDITNTIQLQQQLGGLVDVLVLDDSYHMVTLDRQRSLVLERAVEYGTWLTSRLAPRKDTAPAITRHAAE
jgi:carboxylesterase